MQEIRRGYKLRVWLRPKAYRTKRTLGLCPYWEKYRQNSWRKTRDFCNANAFLHEKTRHSHKAASRKDCKNAYKSHLIVKKHSKHAYKKSDAGTNSGCGLRPKAYRTKRTLGLRPYWEKMNTKHQIGDSWE